ncbi:MAG: hypothetical protein P9X24_00885 [Candidatus Hatepunaea meridiana]|nr:hypothetical protein [Candidatus Hatepunaea meridiana]
MLNDYSGLKYYFLGIFNLLTIDRIKWRISKLEQVISARFSEEAILKRAELGIIKQEDIKVIMELEKSLGSWIIVQTENERSTITEYVRGRKIHFEIFSIEQIQSEVEEQGIM